MTSSATGIVEVKVPTGAIDHLGVKLQAPLTSNRGQGNDSFWNYSVPFLNICRQCSRLGRHPEGGGGAGRQAEKLVSSTLVWRDRGEKDECVIDR